MVSIRLDLYLFVLLLFILFFAYSYGVIFPSAKELPLWVFWQWIFSGFFVFWVFFLSLKISLFHLYFWKIFLLNLEFWIGEFLSVLYWYHSMAVLSFLLKELSVLLLWRWYVFIPGTAFQIYSLSLVLSHNVPRYGSPAWDLLNILNFSVMAFDNFGKFLGGVTSDPASALCRSFFCDSDYMEVGPFVSPRLLWLLVTFLYFHPLVLPSRFDLGIFCWLFF